MASRRRQTGRPCSLWCPRPIRRRYRNRPTFCSHERAVPGLERNVRGRPLPRKEETSACDDCSPRWRPARKKLGRRRHGATLNFLSERRIHGKRGRLTHRVDTSSRAFVCTGARRCKGKKVANHATAKIFRSCGGASLFDSPLDSFGWMLKRRPRLLGLITPSSGARYVAFRVINQGDGSRDGGQQP
jgi:hypothetical protein